MADDEPNRVHGGFYYQRNRPDGRLEPAAAGPPDAVICRRVADFPNGQPPAGAAVTLCNTCAAPIAFNPARGYTVRMVCMQCESIRPEPL